MYSEITSPLLGHALLGAVLAVLALAKSFWLLLAFRSARAAIRELTALSQALQIQPAPQLKARAP
jgi:hypothetical protein